MNKKENNQIQDDKPYKKVIHLLLAHGYLMFLLAVIVGASIDLFIHFNVFKNPIYSKLGVVMIIIGTILVYLAQTASSHAGKIKIEDSSVDGFKYGPYKYFHHPTYLGLFIMTLGLGLILNSISSVVLVIIAEILAKFIFIKKEEGLLEDKYGEIFTDYKKKEIKQ